MAALAKICEDNSEKLDREYHGQRALTFIFPKLIQFTTHASSKIRSQALSSINVFIPQKPQALLASLDLLLSRLFELAGDLAADVRRQVCRAFVQIVEIRPDKLLPHIGGLVDYMLEQQRKVEEEELALDAAEFWLTVGEHENLWQSLGPYLSKIIPVLLESMVYSDDDIAMLEGGTNDAEEEDREEDIKPQFAKSKTARTAGEGDDGVQNGAYSKIISMGDDDLDEGEIDDTDDDDDDANPEEQWSLRKCSAAALDVFATEFQSTVFDFILPYLLQNLRHDEWQFREAAVLALGAVSEGCMAAVVPHLPELVPYLISLLEDPEPLVRIITCWTLGRYSAWAAGLIEPAAREHYFVPMMDGILQKMLDNNKRVQEAGASAFAHLEERAKAHLTPYCEPIIRQFVQCFERYKDRNMFILYDCVQTLAEHVGAGLARPDLVNLLMPALMLRWRKVSDQSRELFPLLECLSYVATALGDDFAAFATPIFTRCIKIIHQNLEEYMVAVNNSILETPDKDFLVTSLDLLSAVIQALDIEKSLELVSQSNPGFFELLTYCMEDPSNDVRQSSYALLGDCAKYVYPQLQIYLPNIMPVVIKQLDLSLIMVQQRETGFSVVNNACWSAGEIAIQNGKGMAPYVPELFQRLLAIMDNPEVPRSVNENAAIALGRLGLANHEALAPHLATFAEPFLKSMSTVDYTEEKASAFKGFTMTVGQNPQAMEKDLVRFFAAIARDCSSDAHYKSNLQPKTQLSEDLHTLFQQVCRLREFRVHFPSR